MRIFLVLQIFKQTLSAQLHIFDGISEWSITSSERRVVGGGVFATTPFIPVYKKNRERNKSP